MVVVKKAGPKARITVGEHKQAADTQIVSQQPFQVEDEFTSLYESSSVGGGVLMAPPFAPLQLAAICTRNNTLQQAVHAMEVNIDGTGHEFELVQDEKDDEKEKKRLEAFFREPFPGMSMISLRRKLRVDIERVGYGYLEVLRNVQGEMVFLRHVPASTIRMLKLDDAVEAERTVMRDGTELKAKMWVRERRYIQLLGTKRLYFKEYGASRDVRKQDGQWAVAGSLKPEDKGSELLRFIVDEDTITPYAIPRWINNLPSVLGSRKAEEFNLDFFDSGGMPPAIIFIQGGALTTTVREQLMNHLTGKGKTKHRAAVVEVQSSGGTLDSAGKVDVKTERFGDARSSDAMFQVYDEKCEERVRGAFRLPPLFFGKSSDYNFATAVVAYMVTEAQVFQSEREEFDEIINSTVMHELKAKSYRFKSKPITLKNAEMMVKALEMAKDKIDGEDFVKHLNDVSGLNMEYSKEAETAAAEAAKPPAPVLAPPKGPNPTQVAPGGVKKPPMAGKKPEANTSTPTAGTKPPKTARKSDALTPEDVVDLVEDWLVASGITKGDMPEAEREAVLEEVRQLPEEWQTLFQRFLSSKSVSNRRVDVEGIDELVGGCLACMGHEQLH